jgi:hypothetical protein
LKAPAIVKPTMMDANVVGSGTSPRFSDALLPVPHDKPYWFFQRMKSSTPTPGVSSVAGSKEVHPPIPDRQFRYTV